MSQLAGEIELTCHLENMLRYNLIAIGDKDLALRDKIFKGLDKFI